MRGTTSDSRSWSQDDKVNKDLPGIRLKKNTIRKRYFNSLCFLYSNINLEQAYQPQLYCATKCQKMSIFGMTSSWNKAHRSSSLISERSQKTYQTVIGVSALRLWQLVIFYIVLAILFYRTCHTRFRHSINKHDVIWQIILENRSRRCSKISALSDYP